MKSLFTALAWQVAEMGRSSGSLQGWRGHPETSEENTASFLSRLVIVGQISCFRITDARRGSLKQKRILLTDMVESTELITKLDNQT